MNKDRKYFGFIILLLLVVFLLFLLFVNPHFIYKTEFNKSFENTESDLNLDNNFQIVDYINKRITNIPEDAFNLEQNGKINETQEKKIIETSGRALDEFSTYNSNHKEENLYNSLFYAQASLAYFKAYPFIYCTKEVSEISKKYIPFFYYLSHSDRERVFNILGTSERLNNYLVYNDHYRNDTKDIIIKAKEAFNIENDYEFNELKCEEFKEYLEKDYKRQSLLIIFKILGIIAIFILGFIVGIIKKNTKKIEKRSTLFSERFSKFFFPEKIEDSTIERTLKTNSILAIFGVFATTFISSNIPLLVFLGIFAIIDVLFILSSIIFGISALNNKSEKGKRTSYCLYSIGIIGFIFLVIFFFIMFIFGNLTAGIKESLQTFLNNQTTVK